MQFWNVAIRFQILHIIIIALQFPWDAGREKNAIFGGSRGTDRISNAHTQNVASNISFVVRDGILRRLYSEVSFHLLLCVRVFGKVSCFVGGFFCRDIDSVVTKERTKKLLFFSHDISNLLLFSVLHFFCWSKYRLANHFYSCFKSSSVLKLIQIHTVRSENKNASLTIPWLKLRYRQYADIWWNLWWAYLAILSTCYRRNRGFLKRTNRPAKHSS